MRAVYQLGSIFQSLDVQSIIGVTAATAPNTAPTVQSLRAVWAVLLNSILFYFIFQIKDGRL